MNYTATRIQLIRKILCERFPFTFAGKGQPKKPLAIGIGEDLLLSLPEFGPLYIGKALSDYTSGLTYLREVTEGADRIDLRGQVSGVVTADEAKHAASRAAGIEHARMKEKPRAQVDAESAETVAC